MFHTWKRTEKSLYLKPYANSMQDAMGISCLFSNSDLNSISHMHHNHRCLFVKWQRAVLLHRGNASWYFSWQWNTHLVTHFADQTLLFGAIYVFSFKKSNERNRERERTILEFHDFSQFKVEFRNDFIWKPSPMPFYKVIWS